MVSVVVFVDPDDDSCPYWWPAVIVDQKIWKDPAFAHSDLTTGMDSASDVLVCYFEDGSFSIVPKTATKSFHPKQEPFLRYATTVSSFLTDPAVVSALQFYQSEGREQVPWLPPPIPSSGKTAEPIIDVLSEDPATASEPKKELMPKFFLLAPLLPKSKIQKLREIC